MIRPATDFRTTRIRREVLEAIRAHARAAAPTEACGALEGATVADIVRAAPTPNQAARPRSRYVIGPERVRALETAAAERGLRVVGFYHSHPHAAARPSLLDIEAAWPWYVYLIAGTDGVRAWRLREDRLGFTELAIAEPGGVAS